MPLASRPVERRIVEAVMIVVAGCQRQPEPHSSNALVATASATQPVDTPPAELKVAGDPDPTQVPDPISDAEKKPAELCAQYKEKVQVDTKRLKRMTIAEDELEPQAHGYWDAARKLVLCTVIRSREEAEALVTRTPTCCHRAEPDVPCSPPYQAKARVFRVVIEHAELHPDGKVEKSELELRGYEKHPEPRHACGRQPEGLALDPSRATTRVGSELARMAELETASVPAFERLARELAAHGAPRALVGRAIGAARDEVRHASVMKRLAEAHGASPCVPRHAALQVRDLLPIAIENAVEGCVREAYGALVASYQAERAEPALRATFAAIARDERAHAALAEDVDGWLMAALDEGSRCALLAARRAALADLRASLPHVTACDTLGLPDSPTAVALFDGYFA